MAEEIPRTTIKYTNMDESQKPWKTKEQVREHTLFDIFNIKSKTKKNNLEFSLFLIGQLIFIYYYLFIYGNAACRILFPRISVP